jgi:hypothetical protein
MNVCSELGLKPEAGIWRPCTQHVLIAVTNIVPVETGLEISPEPMGDMSFKVLMCCEDLVAVDADTETIFIVPSGQLVGGILIVRFFFFFFLALDALL